MTRPLVSQGETRVMAERSISEAEKKRRVPGIEFADGPSERFAHIAGTGMKVWLLVQAYHASGESMPRMREAYPHLSEEQLQAAFTFYREFPEEIDARIALNNAFDIEQFWRDNPWSRPPWR